MYPQRDFTFVFVPRWVGHSAIAIWIFYEMDDKKRANGRTSAFIFVVYLRFASVSSFRRNGKIKLIQRMVETNRGANCTLAAHVQEQTCTCIRMNETMT